MVSIFTPDAYGLVLTFQVADEEINATLMVPNLEVIADEGAPGGSDPICEVDFFFCECGAIYTCD